MEIRNNIVTYAITMMILVILTSFRAEVLAADPAEMTVKITAKKFEYSPNEIRIKKGIPVILEFTSVDRVHGFFVSDLGGIRATIEPGKITQVRIVAPKAGTYEFHCDIFCGDGHEGMTGTIIVED
jgi:cytochrome c oxidase subunit II